MFLEKFLPMLHHEIETKADKATILREIKLASVDDDLYHTEIEGDTFVIKAPLYRYSGIVRYHNSFAPLAKGRLETEAGRTKVKITLRPRIFSMVFLAVFLVISFLGFIIGMCYLPSEVRAISRGEAYEGIFSFLIMFPAIIAMQYFFFKRPARRLCEHIESIVVKAKQARETE